MRLAVLIMSMNAQPSLRNVQAMKDTFIKYSNEISLRHKYDFYTYYYDSSLNDEEIVIDDDSEYSNYHIMRIGGKESVYRTYEKTYLAYQYLMNIADYDIFVRINTSTYLNIKLLDAVIGSIDKDNIYANALNTFLNGDFTYFNGLYPRGDFYIVSRNVIQSILEAGKDLMYADTLPKNRPNVNHVDDTLMGYAFIKAMGNDYLNHLCMINYNFIPQEHISILWIASNFNKNAIATRLKTTPAGMVSGYSWDDNEFRKFEPEKMKTVHDYVSSLEYDENISIKDITVNPDKEKVTIFLRPIYMRPHEIKEIINYSNERSKSPM